MRKRLLLITLALCMLVLGINLITRSGYISGQMRGRVVTLAREELGFDAGMDSLVFNFFP
ncbi:MAG: hypothetical protein HZC51_02615, partial [Nitrospirae bacterium]|nr:hypothetical protein [Nitrospirota bacterium]